MYKSKESAREAKARERARMRARGLVIQQVYIPDTPEARAQLKEFIQGLQDRFFEQQRKSR